MNRFFYPFILLFLTAGLQAATNISYQAKQVDPGVQEKALLWKISGNGLDSPSYLFGTIHLIGAEDYFLPEGTLSAIEQSAELVFEIDMDDMSDISKLMPVISKVMMPDGITLQELMDEEDYKIVSDHFQDMGLPIFFIERIKPMFLYVFAGGDFTPEDIQNGSFKSYEMELSEMANSNAKEVGGLESIEYQMSMFDSISYTDQAQMLVETIKTGDEGDDQFEELVEIYKNQDIQAMHDMMKIDPNINKYENLLLVNRNKNWIPIMMDRMKKQSTFFAVGAGHLAGPDGVINLLRKKGYFVEPVNPS